MASDEKNEAHLNSEETSPTTTLARLIQLLSTELVDIIFDYTISASTPQSTNVNISEVSYNPPVALQINHTSRSASSQLYYTSNTFSFSDMAVCRSWLTTVSPCHRLHLRTLRYDIRPQDVMEFTGVHAMEVGYLIEDVKDALVGFELKTGLVVWISTSAHVGVCKHGGRWYVMKLERCGERGEGHEWREDCVVPGEEMWAREGGRSKWWFYEAAGNDLQVMGCGLSMLVRHSVTRIHFTARGPFPRTED
ncbi:unnamed protein product [Zymoseptoria tritici ST99CH_3D7]|uniref:F-box domain-containing protein n=1 Tax=Zymoseptoria tritici (strain ST99CH_3D7) TaxID=1276538 RepID=A0A1X7S2L5_ZYMT9|nr:unnamed protein product [Zymoseptoria tritici ST99CH_3D7]